MSPWECLSLILPLAGLAAGTSASKKRMPKVQNSGGEPVYEVVSPARASSIKIKPVAPGLNTFEGKTICELWNHVFHGEITFPALRETLAQKYPKVKFVPYTELVRTHGPNEKAEREALAALPEMLKKTGCDAVISGNGG